MNIPSAEEVRSFQKILKEEREQMLADALPSRRQAWEKLLSLRMQEIKSYECQVLQVYAPVGPVDWGMQTIRDLDNQLAIELKQALEEKGFKVTYKGGSLIEVFHLNISWGQKA